MNHHYSSYEQERQRKAAERAAAPKECPHCGAPINQDMRGWGDRIRQHCGSDRCRKAASRANIAERKRLERQAARADILAYGNRQLDESQRTLLMNMTDMLMASSYDEGHQIAKQVVQLIESKRCKHDHIAVLIENVSLARRRANEAEAHNREMEAIYKHRIAELESELCMFQLLQGSIQKIAAEQLAKQPDPEDPPAEQEEPEDEDRARVLATLAQAGLRPYSGQLEEDDPEE